MAKYQVWECKIVIDGDSELPRGFDGPPRFAARAAIQDAGFDVLSTSSGWGGTLTQKEIDWHDTRRS